MGERFQRLKYARSYCIERLVEVKDEIARQQEEGLMLKPRMVRAPDESAEGRIRSRHRFLSRRIDELKAEQSIRANELEEPDAQLNIPITEKASDGHRDVNTESASSVREEHEAAKFSERLPA